MSRFNPQDHPICLADPQWVMPSLWLEHVPFAMYLVDLLRPRVLVELDAYDGVSYCAFCQAIAALQLSTRAFAIGTWQNTPHRALNGPEVFEALIAHHQPRYGGFSQLLRQSFDDAAGAFADGSIDLLHIGGDHQSDAAVRHDFETWLPKLSERAVVLFHTIAADQSSCGVSHVWRELAQHYPHFRFDHGCGLGVLAVGAAYPQALQALLDADAHAAALIREAFCQLGQRLRAHQQRSWQRQRLEALLGQRLRAHQQRGWQRQELAAQLDWRKQTDPFALCCYFDRANRTLTLGAKHFGLRSAAKRASQTESLTLCCYGVELRLVDAAGLGLCERLRETLPPEFVAPTAPCEASITYVVTASVPTGMAYASEYLITCDEMALFATAVEEELYWWLRRDIDLAVARRSPHMLFAHAGVVGWRGVGIVIPGPGTIGKTTLVAALVRRGALYYSDTFAVLDHEGRVHPYRGLLGHGIEGHSRNMRLVHEDGQADPLPIGLIVDGAATRGVVWRPTVVRGPHAALPLLDSLALGREQAARLPQIMARLAEGTVGLRGPRGEAEQPAAQLLDLVDDALVSRALDAAGATPRRLADDLARIAQSWRRAPERRPTSPERHLIAARYVRKADFLPPAEHQRLLEYALSGEHTSWEPHALGAIGYSDPIWEVFEQRLRGLLPYIIQQLQMAWFSAGQIEYQLTIHGPGQVSTPRADAGSAQALGPVISCIYFLHSLPKRFSGGQLRLYDTWMTRDGNAGAGTYTTLEPLDNSLVLFLSDAVHEVRPIAPEAAADACLAIRIRVWPGAPAAQASSLPGNAGAEADGVRSLPDLPARALGSAPALPSADPTRQAKRGARRKRQVAVVVPAHRFPLTADEQIAIRHLRAHLGEFDRYMVGPQAPPAEYADFARPQSPACSFADRVTYNRLLVSKHFYQAFEAYEYILIYQLDCLVFSNALEAWCQKGYDYVGAPWFERWHQFSSEQAEYSDDLVDGYGTVGNGGFSLRKVTTALAVLTTPQQLLLDRFVHEVAGSPGVGLHEDVFWSFRAPALVDEFRIPKPREALQFAFETEPRYCYRENGYQLPFGCHGWSNWERSFWEPFLLT